MIEDFREKYKLDGVAETPAACDLFSPGTGEMLDEEKREDFHTFVAKGLFASKRARPDIQPTIAVLTTRVKEPTDGDWKKLLRLMKYLNGTQDMVLTVGLFGLTPRCLPLIVTFKINPICWYTSLS